MDIIERLKFLSPEDRAAVLESEAVSKQEETYQKPLTQEEMQIIREELATSAIAVSILEE